MQINTCVHTAVHVQQFIQTQMSGRSCSLCGLSVWMCVRVHMCVANVCVHVCVYTYLYHTCTY